MKILEVTIKNVMGLEDLTIRPGCLTLVEGRNGAGKTSVLAALRDLFSGGHDPSLIRRGADEAEIGILLEDGVTIIKTVKPERSALVVRHPRFGKVAKPQAYIDRLANNLSVDPVLFLAQKPKERLQTLLEAMPLRITADQIGFLPVAIVEALDLDRHALEVLGQAHRALYDERTGINKAAKEKRATAAEMSRSLPSEPENGDWQTALASARDELARLHAAAQDAVSAVRASSGARKSEVDAELQRKVDELRTKAGAAMDAIDAERDRALADLHRDYTPKREALNARMTEAQTMLQQQARADEAKKLVTRLQSEASDMERQSDRLTKAIDRLQDLKGTVMERTPIKGVAIQDGEILVDGVVFDRVNEARRIQIALEVARIRAGDLPLILADDLEHFDQINMAKFKEAAKKAGLQIIAAVVTEGDLHVEQPA